MNVTNFNLSRSKTQYDVYKYKLDDYISYNKRKVYRYKVTDSVYDLRTEKLYKYLMKVEVSEQDWDNFKINNSWEYFITSFDLLDTILNHIHGLLKINSFRTIEMPEELEDLIEFKPNLSTNKKLKIKWFNDFSFIEENTLNLTVFSN
jgi:hypothetical protein